MRGPWYVVAALLVGATALCAQSPEPAAAASAAADGGAHAVSGGVTMSGKQAGWRGLYPGQSTRADVVKVLGEPAHSEPADEGLTRLVFGPSADLKFNSVYVDAKGLVKKIGWALFEEQWRPMATPIWSALGEPKVVSQQSFLKQGSIYQWAGAAVWGVADRQNNAIISLVFYDPADTPNIPVPTGPQR